MDWIPIHELRSLTAARQLQGVRVDVLVSPYDVPEAIRGYYAPEKKSFVIEFKYISAEPTTKIQHSESVTTEVGRHSNRLYAISLNLEGTTSQQKTVQLQLTVSQALKNLLTHFVKEPPSSARSRNYELAKDAVAQNEELLVQSV